VRDVQLVKLHEAFQQFLRAAAHARSGTSFDSAMRCGVHDARRARLVSLSNAHLHYDHPRHHGHCLDAYGRRTQCVRRAPAQHALVQRGAENVEHLRRARETTAGNACVARKSTQTMFSTLIGDAWLPAPCVRAGGDAITSVSRAPASCRTSSSSKSSSVGHAGVRKESLQVTTRCARAPACTPARARVLKQLTSLAQRTITGNRGVHLELAAVALPSG
jgi:hypothetical protein